jgi:hypothetical protein
VRTAPGRETQVINGMAIVAAVASAVAFIVLVGGAAARFMGVDDAFYLGIGANIFSGHGPVTALGYFAGQHAPLLPIAITAPSAWFGVDAPSWAHLMVLIGGAAVILLSAWFAWRAVRPAAAVAAAAMLAFPFMIKLAGGMGLDLPAATLALAYVAIGLAAVRHGSIGLGAMAGLVFAAAFLTKEIALPFAPVPLFAALARGLPLSGVMRATAATLLLALAATSWWFVIYAQQFGTVYRIGTPAWALVPIGLVGLVAGILGLVAGRWLPSSDYPADESSRRFWRRVGWIGAAVWAVLLTVMFARTATGTGSEFLAPGQVAHNLATYFPALGSVLAVGLVGAAYEVAHRFRRSKAQPDTATESPLLAHDDRPAIDDLLIATICGFPLILLVVSVGEGPRHYIAQLALLVAVGACGWVRIAERVGRRDRAGYILGIAAVAIGLALAYPTFDNLVSRRLLIRLAVLLTAIVAIAVIGVRAGALRRIGSPRAGVVAIVMSSIVGLAIVVTSVVVPLHQPSLDRTRADAVRTITTWVRANLPSGSSVVLGNVLEFEVALGLQADYRLVDLRDESAIKVRPASPLGVGSSRDPAADDWVALRASPGDVTSLSGYRSSTLVGRLRELGPTVWITSELTGARQSSPIVAALAEARGVTVGARWNWKYGTSRLETTVFRIDPGQLEFPGRVVVTTMGLQQIVKGLEAAGSASSSAAAALLARVEVAGADPTAAGLLDRLRRLSAP